MEPEREPLSQEQIEDLLVIMRREAAKQRKSRQMARNMNLLFGIIIVLAVGLPFLLGKWNQILENWWLYFVIFGGGVSGIQATKAQREAAMKLATVDDVRVVGPMVEALAIEKGDMKEIAQKTLLRLLPRLQFSDASLLDAEQRLALYKALPKGPPELTLAFLKALEQIGEAEAIPHVEKLFQTAPRDSDERRIQEAARACLPYLHENAERRRQAQTLLRSSEVPVQPETLLRPVQSSVPINPNELLRAADNAETTPAQTVWTAAEPEEIQLTTETRRHGEKQEQEN